MKKNRPNIIVFMLDSLRPDHLGCNNCTIAKTPNIDELAAQGINFTNAYSEFPITIPTRTALLAGIYTHTNRPWKPMTRYDLHITKLLKKKGYKTALIGDSPMVFEAFNCQVGFDEFKPSPYGKISGLVSGAEKYQVNVKDYIWGGEHLDPESQTREHSLVIEQLLLKITLANEYFLEKEKGLRRAELVTNWALEWLNQIEKSNSPYFLWIDHFEPHEPWLAPEKFLKPFEYLMDKSEGISPMPPAESSLLSDGVIKNLLAHVHATNYEVDMEVGRVIQKVEDLGLTDNTVFVIISDHGEPYGEHGRIRKYGVVIYDELAKIPFIIKGSEFNQSRKIDALLTTPDISGFLLETAKIKIHKEMESLSIFPAINDKNSEIDAIHDMIFMGAFQIRAGCRTPRWKFIDNRGDKEGKDELYDLINDPKEKNNLIDDEPEIAHSLCKDVWEFGMQWARQLAFRDHPLNPLETIKIKKQMGRNFEQVMKEAEKGKVN